YRFLRERPAEQVLTVGGTAAGFQPEQDGLQNTYGEPVGGLAAQSDLFEAVPGPHEVVRVDGSVLIGQDRDHGDLSMDVKARQFRNRVQDGDRLGPQALGDPYASQAERGADEGVVGVPDRP